MSETGGPEHDYEPVPGLPARLPAGERILWQGAPCASIVSRRLLRSHWIAGYFLVLIGWNVAAGLYDGRETGLILFSSGALTIMATIAIVLLELFAWGVHKTTLYTITNRRVVMRIGVALSATFNLPFTKVLSADIRKDKTGRGDIALTMAPGSKLSFMVFWPHVRGYRRGALIPQMIALDAVDVPAGILASALAEFQATHETHETQSIARSVSEAASAKPSRPAPAPGGQMIEAAE